MKHRLFVLVLLALGGCATAPTPVVSRIPASVAAASAASEAELVELRARNRELGAQLGLARAEAAELRDEVDALREDAARRVVRITPPPACEPAAEEARAEPEDAGPRPVLRLYGTAPQPLPLDGSERPAASTRGVSALPGPEAPAWLGPPPAAAARLPVFATGGDPSDGVPAIPLHPIDVIEGAPGPASATPPDAATLEYRAALAAFSERRIPDAVDALERFVRMHPSHPYADNAMYWRAEIDYTRRDYAGALTRFSSLIERFPRGNKVPDALLRIGLCYERMGRRTQARRVFTRLRQQYPDTVAARMASREDA